jgi:hypothetical protein
MSVPICPDCRQDYGPEAHVCSVSGGTRCPKCYDLCPDNEVMDNICITCWEGGGSLPIARNANADRLAEKLRQFSEEWGVVRTGRDEEPYTIFDVREPADSCVAWRNENGIPSHVVSRLVSQWVAAVSPSQKEQP